MTSLKKHNLHPVGVSFWIGKRAETPFRQCEPIMGKKLTSLKKHNLRSTMQASQATTASVATAS